MTALPKCPTGRKGRHEMCVVVPDSDTKPAVLFCSVCGETKYVALNPVTPLDDLPADALREIAKR